MQNLQSYIKSIGAAKAAIEFGVAPITAYAYMIGTRKPRLEKAREIAKLKGWTLNQVYPNALQVEECTNACPVAEALKVYCPPSPGAEGPAA